MAGRIMTGRGNLMTYQAAEPNGQRPVPLHARIEVVGGVLMIALAALVWFGAIDLAVGSLTNFGSGALPKLLSILLAASGAAIFVQGLFRPDAGSEHFQFAVRPVAIVALAIVLFALFIRGGNFGLISTPQLGLCIVGPITVFLAGSASPQASFRELLVLSFGLTAMMLFVFPDLLRLGIPPFPEVLQDSIPPALGRETALRITYAGYGAVAVALYVLLIRGDRSAA